MSSKNLNSTSDQGILQRLSSGTSRIAGLKPLDLVESAERNTGFVGESLQVSESVPSDGGLDLLDSSHEHILPVMGNNCNQSLRMSVTGNLPDNQAMEDDKITSWRRRNLQRVIDAKYGGVKVRFAERHDMAPPNVSQLVNGPRAFGPEIARRFEEREGLRTGWLDEEYPLTDEALDLARRFLNLGDVFQAKLIARLAELEFISSAMDTAEQIKAADDEGELSA